MPPERVHMEAAQRSRIDSASEGAARFNKLEDDIKAVERNQVFDYLSQWTFEQMLDQLARLVQECLFDMYNVQVGCSLLYGMFKTDPPRYVVGGSSTRRTRMSPSA